MMSGTDSLGNKEYDINKVNVKETIEHVETIVGYIHF